MIEQFELYLYQLLAALHISNWVGNFVTILVITLIVQFVWRSFAKKTQALVSRSKVV